MQTQSWASSAATRRSMQSNRGRDTAPELAVRRILHAAGLRYRVNYRPVPTLRRTADIVFTRQKIAVFIDGCFWHSCPDHCSRPRENGGYWSAKLDRNVERDLDTNTRLQHLGWDVLRFWEHQNPVDVAREVESKCSLAAFGLGEISAISIGPFNPHTT